MATLDLRDAARLAAKRFDLVLDVPEALREGVVATWRTRMVNEHGSARVFDALAEQIAEAGLGEARVRACREFADEERRHGVLCGAVVEAAGGEAHAEGLAEDPFPAHEDTTPLVAALRNALSIGCLSETVAVALIGAERHEMPEGHLRDLLTRIWADEVGHARFAWKLLDDVVPTLAPASKEALAAYLPVALAHLEAHELAHLPPRPAPAGGAPYGLCSGLDARSLFFETVTQVILPRLEALGLPAAAAWAARADVVDDVPASAPSPRLRLGTGREARIPAW